MKAIYKKLLFLLLILPLSIAAQTVGGTVLDNTSGQPVPGVNVIIQGSATGTQTDFDGKFQLAGVKQGDVIQFSYLGYQTASVTYASQATLSVRLQEEANQLSEVVVQIGYGSTRKKDATGSVELITAEEFNKGAIVSVDQLLTGKAAGVRITNAGGAPDAAPNIRIRGGASLSASNNPLIIIDGVPIGDLNPAGVNNPFTLINPNDIESFSILKDASATAIYGVRASNGVIIITTKKGAAGKPEFNFSSSISVGVIGNRLDVLDGPEFTRFIQQYFPDQTFMLGIDADDNPENNVDDPSTPEIEGDNPATPQIEGRILSNTDWQDQILRTAISSDYNFSARANLYKTIPFRASIGYSDVEGLVKTSDYKRLTYSFKMTPKLLNDDLKIDVNAKGTYTDKNEIDETGAIGNTLNMDPTKPVYDSSPDNIFGGYYQSQVINGTQNQLSGSYNPLALLEQRKRPHRTTRFLGNIEFDYKLPFLRDLRAVLNLGLDATQSRIREVFSNNAIATYRFNTTPDLDPPLDATNNFVFNPGVNYIENQTSTNKTMDAYLVYSKNLTGFIRKFDLQGGYSYQNFVTDGNKKNYNTDSPSGLRTETIDSLNVNNRYYSPLNLQAFFGRANVNFLNRYLITATFRADASSLFAKDKRWGYFPAVGVAWQIKEEAFLSNSNFVQDLKLRLGWGKTGQSNIAETRNIGYFPSRPLFSIGSVNGQYLEGLQTYTAKPYLEGITWEKTDTYNIGLDFGFFNKNALSGSIDVYKRETTDLLAVVAQPPGQGTGGTEFIANVGSIEGEGAELSLNLKVIQTDKFNLGFAGNIAYNRNEVTNLSGASAVQDQGSALNQTGVFLVTNVVGKQPYSAWVFEQIYDSDGRPIVGAYVDRNRDGAITNDDRYYKALRPNWTYGFSTSVSYKNIDLTANFRGQIGGQVYKFKTLTNGYVQAAAPLTASNLNNVLNFYNGTADPVFFDGFDTNATFSDYLLEDASFLRCDNITLGFNIPKFVKGSSLRLYTSVNNPFIITDYSGQDPENFDAIDRNFYPRPITYTFGISLDF